MKALFQRDIFKNARQAGSFGIVALLLGACATGGDWPNLATVPPREEAYRQTVTPAKLVTEADRKQALDEVKTALLDIRGDLAALEQQFGAAKSDIRVQIADYEKAIRNLSPSSADTGGREIFSTAQLYLSRLTRSRDILRGTGEKIETRERDLTELKARISGLQNKELDIEAGDLSRKLDLLTQAVTAEVNQFNPYAAAELARMKLLSEVEVAGALEASPPEGSGEPDLVWQAGAGEGAYHRMLEELLKGLGDNKTRTNFLIQAVGSEKALAQRNGLLIKVMGDLMAAGIALDHISLAVKGDPATEIQHLRLYATTL